MHYIRCHYVPFKGKHKDIKTERPAGAANEGEGAAFAGEGVVVAAEGAVVAAEGAAVAGEGVTDLLGRQQASDVGNGVREKSGYRNNSHIIKNTIFTEHPV